MKAVPNRAWMQRYFNWVYKHRFALNVVALVATLAAIYLTAHLQIKSSFSELLPEELPSVAHLKAVTERLGGTGALSIGVESPDFQANKRFVEALAQKLDQLPKGEIRYFEYRYKETRDYIERYGLYYLNEAQLRKVRDRLSHEIESKKDSAVASFLGLGDEHPHRIKQDVDFREMLARELDPRIRRFMQYPEAYLGSDDGKLLVIRVYTSGSSLSIAGAQKLTRQVKRMIAELDPVKFHPQMRVGFAGTVQRSIEEYDTIRHDIVDTSLLLVALIVAVLFLYFWSWRWIGLLVANLMLGVAWTFGLTQLAIGYLNTQTAFLGSLVVGTGINYGIILLARYLEERRRGVEASDAIVTAIQGTAISTLVASSATAVSFASLLVADNKGLSQFGFIGCIGILCCWFSAYLLLPVWIIQWETWRPRRVTFNPLAARMRALSETAGNLIVRASPVVSVILVVLSVLGIYGFRQLAKDPLEYNFSKLQNKASLEANGSATLNKRIQEQVTKGNLSISVVLLDNADEARELCPAVRRTVEARPLDARVFESCSTLWEIVPPPAATPAIATRENKLRAEIRELFKNRMLNFSDSEVVALVRRLRESSSPEAPTLEDLPSQLTRRFEEKDGTIGLVGFITPASDKPLEDARNLFNYTETFSHIELPQSERVVSAAGDAWVLADLLETIQQDGPRISVLAFGAVVLLTFLLSGSLRGGLLMGLCLIMATWWQLCFQGFAGIKFNFFNFIALPITFGIGIDYPINIYLRAREQGFRTFGPLLATTGSAVILCSTTTLIGYYTLLGASNQALTSFAHLAIVGELACLASAIVLLPVALRLMGKFRREPVP
jgi:predicted RND superfamily exporter protein